MTNTANSPDAPKEHGTPLNHDTAWTQQFKKDHFRELRLGDCLPIGIFPLDAWGPPMTNTANSPDAPKEHGTPLNHDTAWTQRFKKGHFGELRLGDCLLIGIFPPRRVGASYYQHRQFPDAPKEHRTPLNHDTAWTQQFKMVKKDHFRELRLGDCLLIGIFPSTRGGLLLPTPPIPQTPPRNTELP